MKEVVDALRTIRAEGEKTAKVSPTASFLPKLTASLASARTALAALGATVSTAAFVGIVRGASDASERVLNLAQSTGTGIRNLQALAFQLRQAGVGLQSAGPALSQFARLSQKAFEGDDDALRLFKAVQLTRKEIQEFGNQDTAQRLEVVGRAFARLPEGPAKAALGVELFGKKATQIVPVVNELGQKGLPAIRKAAEETGNVFSEKALKSAASLGDQLDALADTVQGVAIQFVSGLAPSVNAALQQVGKELASNASLWEEWGRRAGLAISYVVLLVANLTDALQGAVQIFKIDLKAIGDIGQAVAQQNFALIGVIAQQARLEAQRVQAEFEKRRDERLKVLRELRIAAVPKLSTVGLHGQIPGGEDEASIARIPGGVTDAARKASEARLTLAKDQTEKEIALFEAQTQLRETQEKESYEKGLKGLREFFATRRSIQVSAINSEIRALQHLRLEIENAKDLPPEKRKAELTQVDSRIDRLVLQRRTEESKSFTEEADAVRRLADEKLAIDRKIFEARGRQHEIRIQEIDQEIRKMEEVLDKERPSELAVTVTPQGSRRSVEIFEEDKKRRLAEARTALLARAEFDRASEEANRALDTLNLERTRITNDARSGLISQFQAEEQILQVERSRLSVLEDLSLRLVQAAQATSDPQALANAQAFAEQIRLVSISTNRVNEDLARVSAVGFDTLQSELVDLADTGEEEGERFSTAIARMAQNVVGALRRMAAQILSTKILTSIFGLLAPGLDVGKIALPANPTAPVPAFAGGGQPIRSLPGGRQYVGRPSPGFFRGAGTGKSDSNLAWIAHREYIMPEDKTTAPGMLPILEGIRAGEITASDFQAMARGGQTRRERDNSSISTSYRETSFETSTLDGIPRLATGGQPIGTFRAGRVPFSPIPSVVPILDGIRAGEIEAGDFPALAVGGALGLSPLDFSFSAPSTISAPVSLEGGAGGPGGPGGPGGAGGRGGDVRVVVEAGEGFEAKVLGIIGSREGQRVTVRNSVKNRRALRNQLGG